VKYQGFSKMHKIKTIRIDGSLKSRKEFTMESPGTVLQNAPPRRGAQWGRGELRSVYRQKNAPKSLSINILKTSPV
jgi:hypothetical protein